MNLYFLIPSVIFSALVAFFTFMVAHYTKKYTVETRRLWEITKKSYLAKTTGDYLFSQYVYRIKEKPWVGLDWAELFKHWGKKEEDVFKEDCYRVVLEELFPDIKKIKEAGLGRLKKEGYKFTE